MTNIDLYICIAIGGLLLIGLVIDALVRSRNNALSLMMVCTEQKDEIRSLRAENRKLRARIESKKQLTGCVWQEKAESLELEIERKDRAYRLLKEALNENFEEAKKRNEQFVKK